LFDRVDSKYASFGCLKTLIKGFGVAGRDEGVYEWVAANYARSVLQNDPTDTIGVLNLGDESAQVLFCTSALKN